MERQVVLLRSNRDGFILAHPVGTFRGHGGYIGINPYRAIAPTATSDELGKTVLSLLKKSGPTGYHVNELPQYEINSEDDQTRRIVDEYFPPDKVSEEFIGTNFTQAEIRHKSGEDSWVIVRKVYNSRSDCLEETASPTRVPLTNGPTVLGEVLTRLLLEE